MGVAGLEPAMSDDGGFTVRGDGRYATLPDLHHEMQARRGDGAPRLITTPFRWVVDVFRCCLVSGRSPVVHLRLRRGVARATGVEPATAGFGDRCSSS